MGRFSLLSAAAALVLLAGAAGAASVPTRLVQQAEENGSVRVLVGFDEPFVPEGSLRQRSAVAAQRGRIAAGGRQLAKQLRDTDSRVLRSFVTIPYVAVQADPAGLEALGRASMVQTIEEDQLAFVDREETVPHVGATAAHLLGYDGRGQTIAIVDTGVDGEHPALLGKVVAEACYSNNGSCPDGSSFQVGAGAGVPCTYASDCDHGTHVAGIAAGTGDGGEGTAPATQVIALQVFSRFDGSVCPPGQTPCAASYTSDQIAGLEEVLRLADTFPIAAVNLSLGGSEPFFSAEDCDASNAARKAIVDSLKARGILTIAAAGNEGIVGGLTSPSCISSVVGVGASTLADTVAGFSNTAPFLSLLAPGVDVLSSVPGGGFLTKSGSSMAVPHVAGGVALLRQQSPIAPAQTLLERLEETGVPVVDTRNGITFPRIDLEAALSRETSSVRGLLEFPLDGRYASGIGAFTGWLCDATSVGIRVDGGPVMPAAYGTPRNDTTAVCGDNDNGFALLHNFNLDGDGIHTAELIADGTIVSTSTYLVSTFGVPFLREVDEETYLLEGFAGRDVQIQWLTERQGFVIIDVE